MYAVDIVIQSRLASAFMRHRAKRLTMFAPLLYSNEYLAKVTTRFETSVVSP